jgi:ABC-type multidrug transport system fused ATPase/permease subunit
MLNKLRNRWRKTTIGRSARVLSRNDQRKIFAVVLLQIGLGLLDLIGVALIGVLGALAVSGIESQQPGNRVNSALEILQISGMSFQKQVAILGILATIVLVSRTLFSVFFTRRTLFFLSRRAAVISANLVSRLLAQSLLMIQSKTTHESLYAVTYGVNTITVGVLGTTISLISDVSLLTIMSIGLFVVDPKMALGTFLVFAVIALALYRLLQVRAGALGLENTKLQILGNEKIVEVLNSYRESVVRNRRSYYAREISVIRMALANSQAELNFMPFVSKYVIEITVVLGALIIGSLQFLLQDATHAVATLSVFLAAGSRIAPAVLRVQQGGIQIRSSLGAASPTLDLIEKLGDEGIDDSAEDTVDILHNGFRAEVEISNVSLTYPEKDVAAIHEISLAIPKGSTVAFVGPSGAGKTTLIDVLLGVLIPDSGKILISGLPPHETVSKWPGAIAYVPQDVVISNGTVRENIGIGYPIEVVTDELVESAIKIANLSNFVNGLPQGLETQMGERGTKISGGQRQRLGIARAMFTKPQLLVLDEATSSLDGETEASITSAIQELRGTTTVIMIAHRLSTIRNSDIVVYLAEGKMIAKGTFEEVREKVPDFERQAKLMGL